MEVWKRASMDLEEEVDLGLSTAITLSVKVVYCMRSEKLPLQRRMHSAGVTRQRWKF